MSLLDSITWENTAVFLGGVFTGVAGLWLYDEVKNGSSSSSTPHLTPGEQAAIAAYNAAMAGQQPAGVVAPVPVVPAQQPQVVPAAQVAAGGAVAAAHQAAAIQQQTPAPSSMEAQLTQMIMGEIKKEMQAAALAAAQANQQPQQAPQQPVTLPTQQGK